MSGFSDFGSIVTNGAENLSQNAMNIFAKSYEKNVDEMFGRLHGHLKAGERNENYDRNDFKRVAFKSEEQARRFVQAMREQNIEAIFAPKKINGQYLAEIPASFSASDIKNDDLTAGLNPNGKIFADKIIEDYQERTFEAVEMPNGVKYEERTAVADNVHLYAVMTQHLDSLGSVINQAVYRGQSLERYGAGSNKEIWNSKADIRTGAAAPTVNAGKSQKATVINNDIVVIDGKTVHGKVREQVLEQHRKRMEKTDKILDGKTTKNNRVLHSKKQIAAVQNNAEAIKNSIYRQEYVVSGAKNIVKEHYGGELDKYVNLLNTEAIALTAAASFPFSEHERKTLGSLEKMPSLTNEENKLIGKVANSPFGVQSETLSIDERQSLSYLVSKYKIQIKSEYNKETNDLQRDINDLSKKSTQIKEKINVTLPNIEDKLLKAQSGDSVTFNAAEAKMLRNLSLSPSLSAGEAARLNVAAESLLLGKALSEDEHNLVSKALFDDKKVMEAALGNVEDKIDNLKKKQDDIKKHFEQKSQTLDEIRNKIKLSSEELNMFSSKTSEIMKGLEKDFGFKASVNNPITREKLLEMNAEFIKRAEKAGFQFVKANGIFDVEMLKKLNSKQLAKIGISESTRDMLVNINSKGAIGKGKSQSAVSKLSNKIASGTMSLNDDDESQAVMRDFNTIYRGSTYAVKSVTAIRRLSNIRVSDIRNAKKTGWNTLKEAYNKPLKKDKKPPKNKQASPVNAKLNEKYIIKQEKALEKAVKKEKGIAARTKNFANKAKKRVSESLVGKAVIGVKQLATKLLIKGLVMVFGGTVVLGGCIVVIGIAFSCIQSLLDAINPLKIIDNLLAPDSYDETVAYQLYDGMQELEADWLDEVEDFGGIYYHRDTLRFGADYEYLSQYIGNTSRNRKAPNLSSGVDIVINPFWASGTDGVGFTPNSNNSDLRTIVTCFDGKHEAGISANTNAYGKRSEESSDYDDGAYLGYSSIESGHTCNMKDIISMVDVMYMEASDDGDIESILDKSPAQVNWENICNKIAGFFKWLGKVIKSAFTEDNPPKLVDFTSGSVSYKTVKSYAYYLFEASHQQEITLKVEYYPYNGIDMGSGSPGYTPQEHASEFGECVSPVEKNFELFWNSDHVSPFFYGQSGVKYPTDTDEYDVRIDMSNMNDNETACLWYDMDSNQETLEKIKMQIDFSLNGCWVQTEDSSEEIKKKKYASSHTYYAHEDEASYAEITKWFEENFYSARDAATQDESWELSADRNTFTHIWYELMEYNEDDIEKDFDTVMLNPEEIIGYDEDGEPITVDRYYWNHGTMLLAVKHVEKFERSCEKHAFKYCGGHVCVHSQGVVFSATNEQMAMTGILEENQPVAIGYDLKANGYDSIRGKYIKNETDYTSVLTASQSGGCRSPLYDVQGSYSGMQGVNFYVDGEQWGSGFHVGSTNGDSGIGNYHLMRDIFDVDCMIKKGNDTLPIRTSEFYKYEGWSEDNMILALNRMAMDWHEVYGFDIPWEIGDKIGSGTSGFSLAQQDVDNIVDALKSKYGAGFTQTREDAVRLTLAWIGRGHYSDTHKSHNFLSQACEGRTIEVVWEDGSSGTVRYDGSCTAGNDVGFINYIFESMGKHNPSSNKILNATSGFANDYSDCKPMDIIVHEAGFYDGENYFESDMDVYVRKEYNNYSAAIYLGTLDSDLKLTTGQVLHAGVPIIADLNSINNIGNIYLHGAEPSNEEDLSGDASYWWVVHPDSHTKVRRFE